MMNNGFGIIHKLGVAYKLPPMTIVTNSQPEWFTFTPTLLESGYTTKPLDFYILDLLQN